MSFVNEISVAGCVLVIMLAGSAPAQTRAAAATGAANPSPGVHSAYGAAVTTPAAVTPTVPTAGPVALGSSTGARTPGVGAAPLASGAASDMRVGAGDLLQVSVYGAPDFDKKTVRISGSGDIRLPFIGEQHVAGLTIEQTQELIASKLSEGQYFNNPQVSVLVLEFISEGASVLGEVQRPGVYPLLVQARLFDLISMAGGVTSRAGKLVTITHRNSGASEKVTLGNEVQGSTEGNVYVEPGDTVLISKAGIVYVVGDVHLPGGFVIENGKMTVLQAVAMAQGTLGTAKLNGAKLIRSGDGGQQEEVPIRLKQILASKAPDMPLQPEDILFVPGSVGKSAGKRGLEAIVQAATGVAIYGRMGY